MIYVNQEQLDQVKYLLEQSARGVHLLFDGKTLKRLAFAPESKDLPAERNENAEKILEQVIMCPTLRSKKVFLENLDPTVHDDVARVFFNIVQNSLKEAQEFKH